MPKASFENLLYKYYQVVAPVGPLVACTALVIGVVQSVLVEHSPELGIVLVEEIILTDAQPVQTGALFKLGNQLALQVVIDFALALVHAGDGRREQAHVVEVIGLVGADV